jgi:hypothetical protein
LVESEAEARPKAYGTKDTERVVQKSGPGRKGRPDDASKEVLLACTKSKCLFLEDHLIVVDHNQEPVPVD